MKIRRQIIEARQQSFANARTFRKYSRQFTTLNRLDERQNVDAELVQRQIDFQLVRAQPVSIDFL
jgi:hypothetical protein